MTADSRIEDCTLCPRLAAARRNVAVPRGPVPAQYMVIGEQPGPQEDLRGAPFVGPSGAALDKLLGYAGVKLEQVYYTNIVKCFAGSTKLKPTKLEKATCSSTWLWEEIRRVNPQVIILMGGIALDTFFPGEKITQRHGQIMEWEGRQVWVSYHPAYAMRNPSYQSVLITDFKNFRKPQVKPDYTITRLDKLDIRQAGIVALDFETTQPLVDGVFAPTLADPIGLAVALRDTTGRVATSYTATADLSSHRWWLEDPTITKVTHNSKFEYMVCARQGITLRNFHDTKLMAYLLNLPSTELKVLSNELLKIRQQRFTEWDGVSPEYPAADAACTLMLFEKLAEELTLFGLWDVYMGIELPTVPVLAALERTGVTISPKHLEELGRDIEQRKAALESNYAGLRMSNPNHLREKMFGELGAPVRSRTQTGLPRLDKGTLEGLAAYDTAFGHFARDILSWRELDTLYTRYVVKLPRLIQDDGRIHGRFNQAGGYGDEGEDKDRNAPETGRLSSSSPNLQNIPRRSALGRQVRKAFVPRSGWLFVKGDIEQEEPRIAAFLSGDEALMQALTSAGDVYLPIAQVIYDALHPDMLGEYVLQKGRDKKWRDLGKTQFLALLYGAKPAKIKETAARDMGLEITLKQAQSIYNEFGARYPNAASFGERQWAFVKEHGYVQTWFGRKRWLNKALTGNKSEREAARREATNTPVQGTAADVLKLALARVYKDLTNGGFAARLVLTVHDEIVAEAPPDEVPDVQLIIARSTDGLMPIELPLTAMPSERWE